jgi:hypothetical protein
MALLASKWHPDGRRDAVKPLRQALPEHKTLTGVRFCKMVLRVIRIYSTILGAFGIYEETY